MTEPAATADDALDSAIAVTGMSGRFPGAPDLETYWGNLRDGVCTISDFTEAELLADGADPAELRHPDHVPSKGFLPDADRFDADLFGFNRVEAAALDPQHRLLLETAWAALENAGLDPLNAPARTGVYAGGGVTEHMLSAQTDRAFAASLGALQVRILTDREFLAPWISYRLGLDGPSLTVQTACSTSLTAVHLAVQALLLGECDTALAGGVALDSVARRGYLHQQGGIFSPDGRCRPFDAAAGGTVPGNGAGLVVLRRLSDALADGDPVRAVIRGSAVTNDGAGKVGFTAPGVEQQTAAVTEAWSAAGLHPSAAQYLEAHGTATALGDRIECAAATDAFQGAAGTGRIALGSVKSNVGHLDAAAGVAAFIKAVLMLEHATLAPTAGAVRPHPGLGLDTSPFRLLTRPEPWTVPDGGPRRAGVSSVGIGGTNVHVVLEAAPGRPAAPAPGGPQLLPLSARTPEALAALAGRLAAALRAPGAPALADAARTLTTARTPQPVRGWVAARDHAEAAARLDALAAGLPSGTGADHGLNTAGETWLRGEPLPWTGGGHRVALPSYPFGGARHGARVLTRDTPPTAPPADPADPAPAAGAGLETAVRVLLAEALGLDTADDPRMTYFAAGGDSLTAVHLVGVLRDDHGLDVPITLFLEQLTLHEMAHRIAHLPDGGEDSLDALMAAMEAE